jgi:hypothetical protein
MRARIRKHLPTIVVAIVTAAVTTAAPAIGHGVQHALFAHNAEKVDGKSAVGAKAGPNKRAGKLVATNGKGKFPAGVVPMKGRTVMLASGGSIPEEVELRSDGGEYLMMVSGSAFRPGNVGGPMAMLVEVVQGTQSQQSQMRMFSNFTSPTHMAFPSLFEMIDPKKGPFTIRISEFPDNASCGTGAQNSAMFCTATDTNDSFRVTLLNMP